MATDHFYNSHLRKYVVAFGSLFDDIEIVRYNKDGTENHRQKVPLTYSNKNKFITKILNGEKKEIAIKLPRMAFEILGLTYAAERKTSSKRKISIKTGDDSGHRYTVYSPVPYDINFNLSIYSKSQDTAMQIVEQILPFFDPDYTLKLKAVTSPDGSETFDFDVPISILASDPDDSYEGSFDDARSIIWTFSFIMKAYIFGNIQKAKVIKQVETEIYKASSNELIATQTTIPYMDGFDLSQIEKDDAWKPKTTTLEQ